MGHPLLLLLLVILSPFSLRSLAFYWLMLVLFVSFSSSAFATVFTGGGIDGGLTNLEGEIPGTGIITVDDTFQVVLGWVSFGLALLGLAAFLAFLWAGALFILSFGSDERPETARKTMLYAAVGVVVILTAYAITNALLTASI